MDLGRLLGLLEVRFNFLVFTPQLSFNSVASKYHRAGLLLTCTTYQPIFHMFYLILFLYTDELTGGAHPARSSRSEKLE